MIISLWRTLLLKYKDSWEKNSKCTNIKTIKTKKKKVSFVSLNNCLLYDQLLKIDQILSGKYLGFVKLKAYLRLTLFYYYYCFNSYLENKLRKK